MKGLFYNCSSLISLPDISKWNTDKVKSYSGIFYNCLSLLFFINIFNWKLNNDSKANQIFENCFTFKINDDFTNTNCTIL